MIIDVTKIVQNPDNEIFNLVASDGLYFINEHVIPSISLQHIALEISLHLRKFVLNILPRAGYDLGSRTTNRHLCLYRKDDLHQNAFSFCMYILIKRDI